MRKPLTIILFAILVTAFLFGTMAGGPVQAHQPVVKCLLETGGVYLPDVHREGGPWSCAESHCFLLDLCDDESRIYECCYRFNNGECNCLCNVRFMCIK